MNFSEDKAKGKDVTIYGGKDLIIEDGVLTGVKEYVKSNKSKYYIIIPNDVISLVGWAFNGCVSLVGVLISTSVNLISYNTFRYCKQLEQIEVMDENVKYKSIDGNLYSKDGKTLVKYALGKKETSFIIPDGVTSIGDEAFMRCETLKSVIIPNTVTSIRYCAFRACRALESVIIPDAVASIGNLAFINCTSLMEINVSKNNECYQSIDGNLYSRDGKILMQYAIGKTAASFTIPDSVVNIESGAFVGCSNLKTVVFGKNVVEVNQSAFRVLPADLDGNQQTSIEKIEVYYGLIKPKWIKQVFEDSVTVIKRR